MSAEGEHVDAGVGRRNVMVGFGSRTGWVAVENRSQAEVVAALRLTRTRETVWSNALMACRTDRILMVTPSLAAGASSWVLAVGWTLLEQPPDAAALSAALDSEVQHFAGHREAIVMWQRAVAGRLERLFAYSTSGGVRSSFGVPDTAEVEAGLPPGVRSDAELTEALRSAELSEATVLAVAGAWSVDPSRLTGSPVPGPVVVGLGPSDRPLATRL